jgi:anti-anti-sigma regulatory factor
VTLEDPRQHSVTISTEISDQDTCFLVQRSGSAAQVRISGTLRVTDAPALRRWFGRMIDDGVEYLEVDLAGVHEIDRAGLATLLIVSRRLRQRGGLHFRALSDECRHALQQAHLFSVELDGRRW